MTKNRYIALGFVVFSLMLMLAIIFFGDNYKGFGWAAALLAISVVFLIDPKQLVQLYRETRYDETIDRDLINDPLGIPVTWKIIVIVVVIAAVVTAIWGLVFSFNWPPE